MNTLALLLFIGQGTISCPADSNHKPLTATSVIEVINGSEGDLAPDDETRKGDNVVQTWTIAPSAGAKIILRCTYKGVKETTTLNLPKEAKICTKNLTASGKGPVSITCK